MVLSLDPVARNLPSRVTARPVTLPVCPSIGVGRGWPGRFSPSGPRPIHCLALLSLPDENMTDVSLPHSTWYPGAPGWASHPLTSRLPFSRLGFQTWSWPLPLIAATSLPFGVNVTALVWSFALLSRSAFRLVISVPFSSSHRRTDLSSDPDTRVWAS